MNALKIAVAGAFGGVTGFGGAMAFIEGEWILGVLFISIWLFWFDKKLAELT